jgi:hypothetical protein
MAYPSCAQNLRLRDSGFFVPDFSGEYAFYFSTGIGTQPNWPTPASPAAGMGRRKVSFVNAFQNYRMK